MAREKRLTPAESTPAPWPELESDDAAAEAARQLALRVRDALGGSSVRALAHHVGLPHATILRILDGAIWPDMRTLVRLEEAVQRELYPSWSDRVAARPTVESPSLERYLRRDDDSGRFVWAERVPGTWDPNSRDV